MQIALLDEEANSNNNTRPRIWSEHFDKNTNRTFYFNKQLNESVWRLPPANTTLNSYDNVLVTPLKDWIETDVAREFVHDGTTLMLLGLTNYSHWPEAKPLRSCFFEDKKARARLLSIAKERLRSMLHVGLTEDLDLSVASLAAGLGKKLSNRAYKGVPKNMFSYDGPDFDPEQIITYNATRYDPAGKIVTLTVREARLLVVQLGKEMQVLSDRLKEPEQELQELVDKEDAWLEEQEEKKEQEKKEEMEKKTVTAAGKAGGSGTIESIGLFEKLGAWLQSLFNWPPTAAATTAGVHLKSTQDDSLSVDDTNVNVNDLSAAEEEEEIDLEIESTNSNTETTVSQEESTSSDDFSSEVEPELRPPKVTPIWDDEEEEEEEEEKIESPWSERIEKLDAQVFAMQTERGQIQKDIDVLSAIPEVKGPDVPEGRAKLLAPESDFLEKRTLGESYRKCAKVRNKERKNSS